MILQHINAKTTQNISDALREIGKLSALFYLYYYFNFKGWSVYKNYDEKGYDILLLNRKNNRQIKIEVKTRQRIVSSSKNKNQTTHFTLTQSEKDAADYLIGLWYEHNWFFIVPTLKLKETKSNDKKLYKFIVSVNRGGEPNSGSKWYLNNWESIVL